LAEAADLYFEWHGPDDGEPLILSAGLGGSGSYWSPNLAALAAKYRVLVYDHRGTGRSDRGLPEHVTVDDLADDIALLMDELGVPTAHIIGHAAGAVAGLSLALRQPERLSSLVMINGWARPDPHFARCFDARLALLRASGPEAYLRAQPIFLYPAAWISEHSSELDAELPHQLAGFAGADVYEKRIAALREFDVYDRLNDLTVPTLAYASRDDMLVPFVCSAEMSLHGPIELELVAYGGHAINVTELDRFDRDMLAFLAQHSIKDR
jgi:aminoacrylate hydrolase